MTSQYLGASAFGKAIEAVVGFSGCLAVFEVLWSGLGCSSRRNLAQ